jgi:hypothetical protein
MKKLNVILALIMFGFLLNSCNNDSTQASYPYSVSMTDAPGPYQQVNVDVMGVEITGDGGQSVTLNVVPFMIFLNYQMGWRNLLPTH